MPTIKRVLNVKTDDNGYFHVSEKIDPPGWFDLSVKLTAKLLEPLDVSVHANLDIDADDGSVSNSERNFSITSTEKLDLGVWRVDGGKNTIVVYGNTQPVTPNTDISVEITASVFRGQAALEALYADSESEALDMRVILDMLIELILKTFQRDAGSVTPTTKLCEDPQGAVETPITNSSDIMVDFVRYNVSRHFSCDPALTYKTESGFQVVFSLASAIHDNLMKQAVE